jgi:hypothetical protein
MVVAILGHSACISSNRKRGAAMFAGGIACGLFLGARLDSLGIGVRLRSRLGVVGPPWKKWISGNDDCDPPSRVSGACPCWTRHVVASYKWGGRHCRGGFSAWEIPELVKELPPAA